MNVGPTSDLLQHVEQTLHYVGDTICSLPVVEATGIHLDSSYTDSPLLAMENILQRLLVLQPITEAELLNLLELQFTQVEIAKLYGCSPRTIRRRILEYGLENYVGFSDISDQSLDELVSQFVNSFPCAGQKTLASYLHSQTYHIQRWRIRESMLQVDPWGVEQRMRRILHHRKYKVRGLIVCGISMVTTKLLDGGLLSMEELTATLAFLYVC